MMTSSFLYPHATEARSTSYIYHHDTAAPQLHHNQTAAVMTSSDPTPLVHLAEGDGKITRKIKGQSETAW